MRYLLSLVLLLAAHGALAATALPVTIATKHGDITLSLEVASTPATREQGLMNRDTLAPYDGMLFLFSQTRMTPFWMKNTRIPLDILFINEQHEIVHIARQTTPYSETPISSVKPVAAVIELAGGRAAAEKIEPGDHVRYQLPAGFHVE